MRLDLYRSRDDADVLFLDCQSPFLSHLPTRLIVPLYKVGDAPEVLSRLNPKFRINGEEYALMTNYASAMLKGELGNYAGSLAQEHDAVTAAFDMLLHGF